MNFVKPNVFGAWVPVTGQWQLLGPTELGLASTGQNPYHGADTWHFGEDGIYYCANAAALVVRSHDAIAIAFRGTNDNDDSLFPWTLDEASWTSMDPHYDLLKPLINSFDSYIKTSGIDKVIVTGHSLGGAMALGYMQNHLDHVDTPTVEYSAVTFAAPAFDNRFGHPDSRIIQFEVEGDIVPDTNNVTFESQPGYVVSIDTGVDGNFHSMDLYRAIAYSLDQHNVNFEVNSGDLAGNFDSSHEPQKTIYLEATEAGGESQPITGKFGPLYSIGAAKDSLFSDETDLFVDSTIDELLLGGLGNDLLTLEDLGAAYGGEGDDTYVVRRNSDARFELYENAGRDVLKIEDDNSIIVDFDSINDLDTWIVGNDLLIEIHPRSLLGDDEHEGLIRIHDFRTLANRIETLELINDSGSTFAKISLRSVWQNLQKGLPGLMLSVASDVVSALAAESAQLVSQITLSDVEGPYGTLVLDSRGAVVYEDDVVYQSPPGYTYAIAASNTRLAEGDATQVSITVSRTGNTSLASTIDFRLDYQGAGASDVTLSVIPGTLSFAAGQASRTIDIGAVDDNLVEGLEQFAVRLFDPVAPDTVASMKWFTVADNEPSPFIYGDNNGGAHLGSDAAETFYLGEGNDTVNALAGADTVRAGAGNDSVAGGDGADWLYGESGDDTLDGGAGDDRLVGGAGRDIGDYRRGGALNASLATGKALQGTDVDTLISIEAVFGSVGADTLRGLDGAGNVGETLRGNGGNDSIDGGTGIDTAEWLGNLADYTITRTPGTTAINVTHKNAGADGSDSLVNIEHLQFADRIVAFGTRAEDVARVAFALWTPAIYASHTLFSKGISFYDNEFNYSFDVLCQVALQYHPETGAVLAAKLKASIPASSYSQAQLLAIINTSGSAAAVKAVALDPATTQQLELTGVTTKGVVATLNFDAEVYFGLLPG